MLTLQFMDILCWVINNVWAFKCGRFWWLNILCWTFPPVTLFSPSMCTLRIISWIFSHWIWLVLLLSLQVVHGAEETTAENTTPENTSTTPDSSTNQNSTTQYNSNNNSTNNDCDCNCDYFMRQVTCPFDHLDNPHYDKQNDILIFIDQYVGRVCMYDPNTGCTSCTCELGNPFFGTYPKLENYWDKLAEWWFQKTVTT